ncbi:MAG: 16S rRNA (cytidine(1402)-2'-O)-methyltransferase, partial [Thermocrispum sp.]
GFSLVTACVDAGLPVTCLPGPSAVITALALSGLPADRFCFDGFVPRKPGARRKFLAALAAEQRTAVFFESPHRLADTLSTAVDVLGADRPAAVCREPTKRFEQVRRGALGELAAWAADGVRGEITVVLAPAAQQQPSVDDLVPYVEAAAARGERLKDVVASVAGRAGVSARELYNAVLAARQR